MNAYVTFLMVTLLVAIIAVIITVVYHRKSFTKKGFRIILAFSLFCVAFLTVYQLENLGMLGRGHSWKRSDDQPVVQITYERKNSTSKSDSELMKDAASEHQNILREFEENNK